MKCCQAPRNAVNTSMGGLGAWSSWRIICSGECRNQVGSCCSPGTVSRAGQKNPGSEEAGYSNSAPVVPALSPGSLGPGVFDFVLPVRHGGRALLEFKSQGNQKE